MWLAILSVWLSLLAVIAHSIPSHAVLLLVGSRYSAMTQSNDISPYLALVDVALRPASLDLLEGITKLYSLIL